MIIWNRLAFPQKRQEDILIRNRRKVDRVVDQRTKPIEFRSVLAGLVISTVESDIQEARCRVGRPSQAEDVFE